MPTSGDWRMRCRELLQMIWNNDDSEPFREPVDIVEHPGNLIYKKNTYFSFFLINLFFRLPPNNRHPNGLTNCERRTLEWKL